MLWAKRGEALAGRRIKQKILLALALSAVVPLLILTYVLHVHILPLLDPTADGMTGTSASTIITALDVLILFTGFLIAGGCYVIWDLATAVTRSAESVISAKRAHELEERTDEIGTMMASVSRMFTTIEQQATEMSSFAAKLDSAYKELDSANARLKELSFKDEVTGLYNRRFFWIRLEEEIGRYQRFHHAVSVILFDLDGFKKINDELGHAAGDETLRDVAQLLHQHSRGINVLARYGGDEFVILLAETPKSGAAIYAERMRQVVSTHPFAHGGRVSASFGIASLPEDTAESAEELMHAADTALYAAKRAGKDKVMGYEPSAVEGEADKKAQ